MKQIYDAIVVGSGASGGAIAYQLSMAGYKVALLEKGRLIHREEFSKDEIAYCRRDTVTPNLKDEYHTLVENNGGKSKEWTTFESGWSFWNGNIVGGSSNFMSGMFHRMHPNDFKLLSTYGAIEDANIVDWPIQYEELEPYYALTEKLVGISGKVQSHPLESPRSTLAFPYPPTAENEIVKLFDSSCKALGVTPLVTPRAILSKDTHHRYSCYYSNFCGSYGCSSGAKGSSREAFIIPALASGNLTLLVNSHVTRFGSDKKSVTGVEVVNSITRVKTNLTAKVYIVATQAHESARLLLNSANKFHPSGLSNSSGELGKNLIFSGGGSGQGVFKKNTLKEISFEALMQKGLFVNRSILDWYELENLWGKRIKGGLVEFMFEHQNNIARALKSTQGQDRLIWGEALGRDIFERFTTQKTLRFEIFNDWLPTDACYVSLDKTKQDKFGMPVGKLSLHAHPQDVNIGNQIAKKCEELLEEMGAEDIYSSITNAPPQNLIAGGCRFGDDPAKSVLNKFCQSHDIENLFVADASFMPTGGSVPYTWTIYANALRVGEHIVSQLNLDKFNISSSR